MSRIREPPGGTVNARNATTPKTLVTEHGRAAIKAVAIATAVQAEIIRKGQRRVRHCSRGSTTRSRRAMRAGWMGA
jgi:hypothetical protein